MDLPNLKVKLVFRLLGKYCLSMAIPAFIILFYTVYPIRNVIINFLRNQEIYYTFRDVELYVIILGYIIIPTIMIIYDYTNRMANSDEQKEKYKTLIIKLGDYSSAKVKTFYQYPQSPSATIIDCIKPDTQLAVIRGNIIQYYTKIYDDDTIWCDFFAYKNGNLIYIGDDEPTQVKSDIINNPNSTAMLAVTSREMVIVQNTKLKIPSLFEKVFKIPKTPFVKDKSYDIRSIICYPVLDKGNVVYVINVSSRHANTFRKKKRFFYEFALGEFAKQIHLELIIKDILELEVTYAG